MDVLDYIQGGIIGCHPSSSVEFEQLSKIIIDGYGTAVDNISTTYRAVRDAHFKALQEFFYSGRGMFLRDEDVVIDEYPFHIDVVHLYGTDLHSFNKLNAAYIKIIQAARNLLTKDAIFWNSILPYDHQDKVKQSMTFIHSDGLEAKQFSENISFPTEYINIHPIPLTEQEAQYTIDYQNNLYLTREIYDDYVNAVAELLYCEKVLVKLLSGSDLEVFIPPTLNE